MPTFSIQTLGCRANQADSERLRELLLGAGFTEVGAGSPADCSVVNTCTVTHEADRKSRQLIRRAHRLGGQVVATGCGLAPRGGAGALPSSVLRLPPDRRESLLELLGAQDCPGGRGLTREIRQLRSRALLKVQEGCDQFCTFCVVPYVRGRSRSLPVADLVDRARQLEAVGYRELVLTGIHLAVWGRDLPGQPDLSHLLGALLEGTREARLRLSSVEPQQFPRPLLDLMARRPDRICPHLHLALQHASDRVLERMRRGYDLAGYDRLVEELLQRVPGACLTTDVLVGFPGETEDDFRRLLAYLRRRPFFRIHVFPYSPRAGTAAARWGDPVPPQIKQERVERVLALAGRARLAFMRRHRGEIASVLVEQPGARPGELWGTTENYLPVAFRGGERLLGGLVRVRLGRVRGDRLTGTLEGEEFLPSALN